LGCHYERFEKKINMHLDKNITSKKNYHWKAQDDKPFFGVYTNLARHNITSIIETIQKIVLNEDKVYEESELWNNSKVIHALLKKNNEIQQVRIIRLLDEWLPFTTVGTSNPKEIAQRLSAFWKRLNQYRDYYSHSINKNELLIDFNSSAIGSQKKYDLSRDIKLLKQRSVDQVKKRFKIEEQKRHSRSHNPIIVSYQENPISKEQGKKIQIVFSNFQHSENEINETDFLFFLSLFLQKKQMTSVLNLTKYKKDTREIAFQVHRECYHGFHAKPSQPKLNSSRTKDALSLTIINELSRFPKHLKKHLQKEYAKKLFIKEESFIYKDIQTEEKSEAMRSIEMLRHNDSFSFLALQYIEHNDILPDIQFQINLGKRYLKEPYTKNISGQTVNRDLRKDIIVYGKLNDFDEKYFEDHINTETTPHEYKLPLAFFSPKYHIHLNRIGLKRGKHQPITLEGYKKYKNPEADFIISEKVLPSLIYLSLIDSNPKSVKNVLDDFYKRYKDFLKWMTVVDNWKNTTSMAIFEQTIYDKFGILSAWIPMKFKNYFSPNRKTTVEVIRKKLQKWIDENTFLLEAGDKEIEKRKEYEGFFHFSFKAGDRAEWLARDINRLKPLKRVEKSNTESGFVEERLNAGEYNLLQSKLALFARDRHTIRTVFQDIGLTKGEYKHPFLENVDLSDPEYRKHKNAPKKKGILGIKTFMKRYLEVRGEWLKEQLASLDTLQEDTIETIYYYIDTKASKNSEIDIAKNANYLLSMPLYVPNNVFNHAILKAKSTADTSKNVTWHILQDAAGKKQWFYDEDKQISLPAEKAKAQRTRFFDFRKQWLHDFLLWEILKQNAKHTQLATVLENLSLSNYTVPEAEVFTSTNILNTPYDMIIPLEYGTIKYTIIAHRKLRDYGAYRYFLKDRRLEGVLSYYDNEHPIPVEILQDELDYFERKKFEVLTKVYELETVLYQKHTEQFKQLLQNEKVSLKFRTIVENFFSNDTRLQQAIEIRNKLLHNQFPKNIIQKNEIVQGKVSETLFIFAIGLYDSFLSKLV